MEHGLKLKPSKCCFLSERVTYVGHQPSADGVSPDPDKAVAVAEWKVPSSVKELSSFLEWLATTDGLSVDLPREKDHYTSWSILDYTN